MDTPNAHPSGRVLAELANAAQRARKASLDLLLPNAPRPCNRGYLRHVESGALTVLGCWSWLCPRCAPRLRAATRKLIIEGADLVPADRSLALFTFTEPTLATLTLPTLKARFDATIKRLSRALDLGEWFAAIEFQQRGAFHPHLIASVPSDLAPLLRRPRVAKRTRDQYRWWSRDLRELATGVGWGPVCDAVAIDRAGAAAHYVTKSLAGYVTKEAHDRFKRAGATRVRPTRRSRGWHPQTLHELRRPKDPLPGRWEVVRPLRGC